MKNNDKIPMPYNVSEFRNKKGKKEVKTVAFKFKFPSGEEGIISITHLSNPNWNYKEINSITIDYADTSNKQ